MSELIRIATRRSALALWQSEHVAEQLRAHWPECSIEFLEMTTKGDKILGTPLAKIGGKGLFIKELEQALLDDRADIAVHSMKDVGTRFPSGLGIHATLERADPRDAFVSDRFDHPDQLPDQARIGTCSLRRQSQLGARYPNIQLVDLRGNVNTRLQKLAEGQFEAIILAEAGLRRLQLDCRRRILETDFSLPAIGQGAIGIECRLDDARTKRLIAPLNHAETALRLSAERSFGETLQASCQMPVAAYAQLTGETLRMDALIGLPNGRRIVRGQREGPGADAVRIGADLADELLDQGGREILAEISAAG